ncbi:MAG: adenosylmethionine decarboxylase [Candidatus Micrarchaeia archaeon]
MTIDMEKNPDTQARRKFEVTGKHLFGNLYGIDENLLKDSQRLEAIVNKAVEIGKMTLVSINTWDYGDGNGVSVVAIIKESHIALHTWPEGNYATLDVYTCGSNADPYGAFDYILKELKPEKYEKSFADRSYNDFFVGQSAESSPRDAMKVLKR